MWNSFASLESLVVPCATKELPGILPPQDDDNPSSAKRVKISSPLEDFPLPPGMARAYATEAARLQAMQAKILPYLPAAVVSQPPGQCPPEPENDRRMYVPSLSQSLTRRDIFNHFSTFGALERVALKNAGDAVNYAIVLFSRTSSMQLAISANPHSIKGHCLLCRKAAEKKPSKDIRQFVPTKPVRTVREDNPLPQTLAAKLPETNPKKKPEKSAKELEVPKRLLRATPARLERSMNLNTKLKQNLMASEKSLVPRKGDQTYVYSVAMLSRTSPWSFNLASRFTTPEEKKALSEGLPSAAIKLLEARDHKSPNSSTKPMNFAKPTIPLKTEGIRKKFLRNSSPIPPLSTEQVPIIISEPDCSLICTTKQMNSISNASPVPVVLPTKLNLEFHKSELNRISANPYFGPDFRYEHHCYTNVIAYKKTRLYIDLQPGEREKRQTIKEFIDQIYVVNTTKH